jgi:hypothetical protein
MSQPVQRQAVSKDTEVPVVFAMIPAAEKPRSGAGPINSSENGSGARAAKDTSSFINH